MIAQNKDMNVAGICTRVPHLPTEIKLSATLIFLTFGILCTCASLKKETNMDKCLQCLQERIKVYLEKGLVTFASQKVVDQRRHWFS